MINIQLTLTNEINKKSDPFCLINHNIFNMGFLKLFGRILIVTALISSAYFHLETPEQSIQEFQTNYSALDSLSQQYLKYDIPLDNSNWKIAVKIFGAFEVLVVLLIVLGDSMGGALYVFTIFLQIFFLAWGKFSAGSIANWSTVQLQEASRLAALFGISLILSCSGSQKAAKK